MKKLKSFGQHFLHNESIAAQIADSILLPAAAPLNIVEVGPGQGALTRHLLLLPNTTLYAIELDHRLPDYLRRHFPALADRLIVADVLQLPFDEVLPLPFALVGNFPYNISTQIIFKMLDYHTHIPQMVGMFQKEVAVRLAAREGNKDYGITSILVQAYYTAEYLFTVDACYFDPPPKVQSGVIRLMHRTNSLQFDGESLRKVVKTAFNQRRKKLSNALSSLSIDRQIIPAEWWDKRPEQLSVEDFILLSKALLPTSSL